MWPGHLDNTAFLDNWCWPCHKILRRWMNAWPLTATQFTYKVLEKGKPIHYGGRQWTPVGLLLSRLSFHSQFQVFMIKINTYFSLKYKAILLVISSILWERSTKKTFFFLIWKEQHYAFMSFLRSSFTTFFPCVYLLEDRCTMVHVERWLTGVKPLLYHAGSGDTTQVRNIGVMCLCMLSHLTSPLKGTWSLLLSGLIYKILIIWTLSKILYARTSKILHV